MGIFSGFLRSFSSKDIKETVKQFSELRENYIRDQELVMQQIEDMRSLQDFEQSKADEALSAAREKARESILKKKIAEEKKSEKYIKEMNNLRKMISQGERNPAFLSGLLKSKTLIGKK